MVRILITGARGGLGAALAGRLSTFGLSLAPALPGVVEVVALGRPELDVTRRDQVEKAFREHKPDVVLNAAGITQLDFCESHQWESYLVNRDGAEQLARECSSTGALLVYFGTDLVFDGAKRMPYGEEDPPNPLNVYGDTKLAGELVVMKQARRYLIVRTGWLYGHSGRHFLKTVQQGPREDEVLLGYDDQVGQPTYVSDFLDALQFMLSHGLTGRYHAANSGECTPFGCLKRCVEALGIRRVEVRPVSRTIDDKQAMRPRYSVLGGGKLEQAGWKMRPWDAALAAFVLKLGERSDDTRRYSVRHHIEPS